MQRTTSAGAEVRPAGVHFRVWAPRAQRVEVVLEGGPGAGETLLLEREPCGYFSGLSASARAGSLYRFRLDERGPFPDPASRFQPDGPLGPSEVIDPAGYPWRGLDWRGELGERPVLYELHVGTFTPEGTWRSATARLPHLADLGVNVIEIMPIADFVGDYGWGYDGVNLYAPTRLYGRPDDFRYFVDAAHVAGINVILDVVYNHFGPVGCFLREFSENYFADAHTTDWGDAIRFYGPDSRPVRDFFCENAAYWIREFHLDGLRLDATQNIYDRSEPHILQEAGMCARAAALQRNIFLIAENEPQDSRIVQPIALGGLGLDALWNDDFHHSAIVAATGRSEAYYTDYRGTPQELISTSRYGFLYQGQYYTWQKQRRGRPALGLQPRQFINYLQNHDQIANSGHGERLHELTSAGRVRALTALLLLGPGTPLLFQGQEFAASTPFLFFADHEPGMAEQVQRGRREFLSQFPSLATLEMQHALADPMDRATYERCRLDWADVERHAHVLALHRDLIRLSRSDRTLRTATGEHLHGAVLAAECFLLRFLSPDDDDRLLLVNLGRQLDYVPAPEPLLAAPPGSEWHVLWSSEDPAYGGAGTPAVESPNGWRVPPASAVLFSPVPILRDRST